MVETWSLEYHFLCDIRAVEEIGFMTSQGCMRHASENANFQNSKASCVSHCFSLLLTAWLVMDSGVWATDEDWVSSDCCVLASGSLLRTFKDISRNIQTLVLTIKVPFNIKDNVQCMFLLKKTCKKIRNCELFSSGESSTWCISAHSWEYQTALKKLTGTVDRASKRVLLFLNLEASASCQLKKSHMWRPRRFNLRYQPTVQEIEPWSIALLYNFLFWQDLSLIISDFKPLKTWPLWGIVTKY